MFIECRLCKRKFRSSGVVGRILAFQPGGRPQLDARKGQEFSFLSFDWVCALCLCFVLCCLWRWLTLSADHRFQGGPLCFCLVFWSKVCDPLQASDPRAFVLQVPEGVSHILWKVNNILRKKEKWKHVPQISEKHINGLYCSDN